MKNSLVGMIPILERASKPPVNLSVPLDGQIPIELERIVRAPSERTIGTRIGLILVGIGLLTALVGGIYKAYTRMSTPEYRALIEEAAEMPGTPINEERYHK